MYRTKNSRKYINKGKNSLCVSGDNKKEMVVYSAAGAVVSVMKGEKKPNEMGMCQTQTRSKKNDSRQIRSRKGSIRNLQGYEEVKNQKPKPCPMDDDMKRTSLVREKRSKSIRRERGSRIRFFFRTISPDRFFLQLESRSVWQGGQRMMVFT
jgi:hypothetical protein